MSHVARSDQKGATGKTQVALGFRTHSGWSAVVAVTPSANGIDVIDRRRIELADPEIPGSLQPYHAAEEMDAKRAEAYVSRCIKSTRSLAGQALKTLIADLRVNGHTVVGCGILLAAGKPLPGLASILASHALIHTAEGELYRDAIMQASKSLKIPVTAIKERDLFDQGAAQLRLSADILQQRINEIGRAIGPPWRQDHKYAALVGWLSLNCPATS